MLLMHKNDEVAKLTMYNGKPMGVSTVLNDKLMPMGSRGSLEKADEYIPIWHTMRAIPRTRINAGKIFEKLGEPGKLSVNSHGLSLTDCYWYKEEDANLTWEKVNLFTNPFSPDIYLSLYDKLKVQGTSPDYTTDGMLEKFWTMMAGKPHLVKSGEYPGVTNGSGILAANEVAAYRIAELMNIPHIDYRIVSLENLPGLFSASRCFVENDSLEFVPASLFKHQYLGYSDADSEIEKLFIKMGMKQEMKQMKKFDFMIGNHDRHLGNFGVFQNSETMEVKGFVPLFDSGSSLGWDGEIAYMFQPFAKNKEECAKELVLEEFSDKEDVLDIIRNVYEKNRVPEYCFENAKKTIETGYELVAEKIRERSAFFPEEMVNDGIEERDGNDD